MMKPHQPLSHALTPRLRRGGFSLLELSVVLGIIALIAGAGVSMASGALKTADRIATQEKLNTIKLALDSHARIYGYLPCPAKRDIAPTNQYFGIETRYNGVTAFVLGAGTNYNCAYSGTPAGFSGVERVASNNVYVGAVPTRSLGLPDSYASDSWGNKLSYSVSRYLTTDPSNFSTVNGHITVQYRGPATFNVTTQRSASTYTNADAGGDASLTFAASPPVNAIVHLQATVGSAGYNGSYWVKSPGTNPVKLTTDGPGTTTYLAYKPGDTGGNVTWQVDGNAASYVVVSHGPDGLGAYPTEASSIPTAKACAGVSTLDGRNCDDDSNFVDADYNDGAVAAQYFDDFIVWGSSSLARTAVNDGIYTSATTSSCPTGICEPWCAACTKNYPGGIASAPPVTTASPAGILKVGTAVLCKKVLSSSATTCTATCFWGGLDEAPAPDQYYKCP